MNLKIAFITYEYPPDTGKGGIGTYTHQMALLLQSVGVVVHIFAGSHSREIEEDKGGIVIHRILCESPQDFRAKVVEVFKKEHEKKPFDIIESAEIHSNALEVKRAFPSIPLVVRLHAPDYIVESLKKRYVPFLYKLRFVLGAIRLGYWDAGYWRNYHFEKDPDFQFTNMADAVTAPSTAMKDWVVENWKIRPEKISVISNPFQPSDSFLNLPVTTGFEHKTIIFFGRLNVLKGLVNATKAMKKIMAKHPEWKFKVIGDDGAGPIPGGQNMREWMKEYLDWFKERVFFYDGVSYDSLPELLKEGEIVILPSLFESFSYTCIEAMAAGKVVVGSNIGGMNDLIESGKTGVLIDPENVDELYRAINSLITDPVTSFEMAKHARMHIMAGANRNDKVLSQTINLYRSLMHE